MVLGSTTKVVIKRVVVISRNVLWVNLLEILGHINFDREIHRIENVTVNVKAGYVYLVSLRRRV